MIRDPKPPQKRVTRDVNERAAELREALAAVPQPKRSRLLVRLNSALRSTDSDHRDAELADLDKLVRRDAELRGGGLRKR